MHSLSSDVVLGFKVSQRWLGSLSHVVMYVS